MPGRTGAQAHSEDGVRPAGQHGEMTNAGGSSSGAEGGAGRQAGPRRRLPGRRRSAGSERRKTGRRAGPVGRRGAVTYSPLTRGPWGKPAPHDLPARGSEGGIQGSPSQNDKALLQPSPWRRVRRAICRAHAPAQWRPPRGRETG